MKQMTFVVPFYEVKIMLYQVESPKDAPMISKVLKRLNADKEASEDIISGIERGAINGGETFRDFRRKLMVIIFYEWGSEDKKTEVFAHEKRHVEDRIMEFHGVHDIESAGMLAGWLAVKFRKFENL